MLTLDKSPKERGFLIRKYPIDRFTTKAFCSSKILKPEFPQILELYTIFGFYNILAVHFMTKLISLLGMLQRMVACLIVKKYRIARKLPLWYTIFWKYSYFPVVPFEFFIELSERAIMKVDIEALSVVS